MSAPPLPVYDEKLVIDWLLADAEVVALPSGEQIWSALPTNPAWPAVRATRIGGTPPMKVLWLDQPLIQFDVWGGPKAQARTIADTIRLRLTQMAGAHELGTVTDVVVGGLRYFPDGSYEPARPRYSFDVSFTLHPPTEQ